MDRRYWSLEDGLNRVLGLGLGCVRLTEADYLCSHLTDGPHRVVAHLYARQLTLEELHTIEISAVHSRDHGLEVGRVGRGRARLRGTQSFPFPPPAVGLLGRPARRGEHVEPSAAPGSSAAGTGLYRGPWAAASSSPAPRSLGGEEPRLPALRRGCGWGPPRRSSARRGSHGGGAGARAPPARLSCPTGRARRGGLH